MPLRRDGPAHQIQELGSEQRVMREIVDAEPLLVRDRDIREARFAQPLGEDTLRHRTGNSASPGLWIDDHFRGQVLLDDDVGDRDPTTGSENAERLEEHAALAW